MLRSKNAALMRHCVRRPVKRSAKDKLASKWNKADSNALIVDVDCTTDDAKDLCSKYGVQGYPTLKYFSPSTSKEGDTYEDARDLKTLNKFVKRTSKLPCVPDSGENCDKKDTAYIEDRQSSQNSLFFGLTFPKNSLSLKR